MPFVQDNNKVITLIIEQTSNQFIVIRLSVKTRKSRAYLWVSRTTGLGIRLIRKKNGFCDGYTAAHTHMPKQVFIFDANWNWKILAGTNKGDKFMFVYYIISF